MMIEIKNIYEEAWNGRLTIYKQDKNPVAYVSSDMIALVKAIDGKIDDRSRELQNITLTRIVVNAGSAAFNLYTKMTPAEIMSLMK